MVKDNTTTAEPIPVKLPDGRDALVHIKPPLPTGVGGWALTITDPNFKGIVTVVFGRRELQQLVLQAVLAL